jgi:glutathione S-transferase
LDQIKPRSGRKLIKLHYNVASPYVRKVMAVAMETGLEGRLEPVTRMMTPVKPDAAPRSRPLEVLTH